MVNTWAGVDIGGTKVAVALVDSDGNIAAEGKIATEVEKGPEHVVQKTVELIRDMETKTDLIIEAIGVGSPGPLDSKNGIILSPSNLHSWHGYPIVDKLESQLDIHTLLGNDADLAALAEYRFGLHGHHENMVYATVSTGVGGGIISKGHLHTGATSAAEFGHMIVDKDGPLCGCGRHGCLETFSSGTGIANRMTEGIMKHPDHSLYERAKSGQLNSQDVFEADDQGDSLAREVITKAEDYLAISLANIVNVINPTILVIGGGVALGQPRYFEAVKEKISYYAIKENIEAVEIVKAKFLAKAGVIGAAALAMTDK